MAQPTFWQKIRYWLRGEKVASALSPLWETMQPQYAMEGSFSNVVTEGYRKNELIYACIMAKAKTAQQIAGARAVEDKVLALAGRQPRSKHGDRSA